MPNNIVSRIGIKDSSGTDYDYKEIGAKAQNVLVGVENNGDIIQDVSDLDSYTTLPLSATLAEFQKPHSWSNGERDMGKATEEKFGHVAVGTGLKVNDGVITPNFGKIKGTVCEGDDGRLSDRRLTLNPLNIGNKVWNGSQQLTVTPDLIGAAPANHTTTMATNTTAGHVKILQNGGLNVGSDGTIAVDFGTGAYQAVKGNDFRLSNVREPSYHANQNPHKYGAATTEVYGHTILQDTYDFPQPNILVSGGAKGVGASSFALQSAFTRLNTKTGLYISTNTKLADRIYTYRETRMAEIRINRSGHYLISVQCNGYGMNRDGYICTKIYSGPVIANSILFHSNMQFAPSTNYWETTMLWICLVNDQPAHLNLFVYHGINPYGGGPNELDVTVAGVGMSAYRIGDL